ncbi:transposase [Dysgonomonas sp. 511]|uniref:transposase n=1 Tax=Dysgonomonas sp. 511 TaxID=2302930 RepID=UPI0013D6132B|nr:transposase [Dysgonomonas sp. 511]NDV77786.1 hypothetical protein [Dysgonomonas sp. 511]
MVEENLPHRRSIRLHGYDYSQGGLYFVTICVKDKECLFGTVVDGDMVLNEFGNIVKKCWLAIPEHYAYVVLHGYIIMPNHIHGIIEIGEFVGANYHSPENEALFRSPSGTIGSIIRGLKIGVMKWYKEYLQVKSIWQRSYYEHIIRNDESYQKITEYIYENPGNWLTDDYYK